MPKLNDTHTILLSTASQRESGSIYPLPSSIKPGAPLTKALATLTKYGLIEERETSDAATVSRSDGDVRYGLFVTPAGLRAIGIEPVGEEPQSTAPAQLATPPMSKLHQVLALLQRADGATSAELIAATGWLPHTTRAALTGLRKKGHTIERSKREDATCYRITNAA